MGQKLAIWHILPTIHIVMRRSRRRTRNRFHYRRRRRNWWPWLIFVLVAGLFLWAILQFFMVLFSNVRSESVSAELQVERGRAEFLLPEKADWNPAFSEQTFLEGDAIRTAKNSQVTLSFLEDNKLILDQNTELKIIELSQKSSGKTLATFELMRGQVWGQINDTAFGATEDSMLNMSSPRAKTYVTGTTFNLSSDAEADIVSLIKGEVNVDIFAEDEKNQSLNVGVGQKVVINDGTYDLLSREVDPVEAIESTFKESNWYLENLARQFPEEAESLRARILPATQTDIEERTDFSGLEEDSSVGIAAVTSPVEGQRINADEDLVPIKGTAPLDAFQIQVNDYVLQRFEPGDRKWTYIAAKEYGTLKPGENTYDVIAITRDGKRSPVTTLTIFYEGTAFATPAATTSPSTSTPATEQTAPESSEATTPAPPAQTNVLTTIDAPVVTRPALFAADPSATYETSASVVTFSGTVSAATQAVEVNNFRLRKFNPGDTTFAYIANANYGNLADGENIYSIVAFDAEGKTTQTQIKIFYRPVNID